jgi:hypothetical protein
MDDFAALVFEPFSRAFVPPEVFVCANPVGSLVNSSVVPGFRVRKTYNRCHALDFKRPKGLREELRQLKSLGRWPDYQPAQFKPLFWDVTTYRRPVARGSL